MSNKLRIVIDIGNSNLVIGLNNNKEWIKIYRINTKSEINYWSFEKKIKKILGENNISPSEIYSVTVSSVVPSMTDIIKLVINDFLFKEILLLVPETNNIINIKIDDISEIGSDLVANSIAARSIYKSNIIVVDFGTALTFTSISNKGDILGVSIVPGIKTSINSLYKNTAKLPKVSLKEPLNVIGKNTTASIQSGITFGFSGLVKEILAKTKKELKGETKVIATGGMAKKISSLKVYFNDIIPTLTLDGLLLFSKNNN
tara:strand:+ start:124 stop:900 length:777 start_codon:yes stop_codon:yes gene_type:complete